MKTRNKRAQGISITTIIIAAVALIVLIVLIAIFTGKLNLFSKGYGETTEGVKENICTQSAAGAYCQIGDTPCSPKQEDKSKSWIDCGTGIACCN